MAAGPRIRGQEVFVQLIVDGDLKQGSFTKVENFKLTPRADLSDSSFLGETEDEPDVQHHGYDFSFTIHEADNQAVTVWNGIVASLTAGILLPVVNVVVIKKYRDPGVGAVVQTLQNCKIKLDSQDFGGRKEYVKNSFSGKARQLKVRP